MTARAQLPCAEQTEEMQTDGLIRRVEVEGQGTGREAAEPQVPGPWSLGTSPGRSPQEVLPPAKTLPPSTASTSVCDSFQQGLPGSTPGVWLGRPRGGQGTGRLKVSKAIKQ